MSVSVKDNPGGTTGDETQLAESWFMVLRAAFLVALISVLVTAGCGQRELDVCPVSGVVTIDGRPTAGVMVVFCPVEGDDVLRKLRPFGFSGAEGKFQLTTVKKVDGAPAGHYRVLLQWVSNSAPAPNGEVAMGPDRLHGRYMDLTKSQFVAVVRQPATNVGPFELNSN